MRNHSSQQPASQPEEPDQLLAWLRRLWPIRQAETAAKKLWKEITKAIFGEDDTPPDDGANPEPK